MSDVMDEVGAALRGPLIPDRSKPIVEFFDLIEEVAKVSVSDADHLQRIHHGFDILRLASHFDFKDAYIPDDAREAMFQASDFYVGWLLHKTVEEAEKGALDVGELHSRLRLAAGMGTIMGYLSRALEVDGRWPSS